MELISAETQRVLTRETRGKIVGFTASRTDPILDERHATGVGRVLGALSGCRGFVTGGARGGDHRIAEWLLQAYPEVPHLVCVPSNLSQVTEWWTYRQAEIEQGLRPGRIVVRRGGTYAERNQAIVDASDVLVGFPWTDEDAPESVRSGSWQTIRMARRKNIATCVFPMEES